MGNNINRTSPLSGSSNSQTSEMGSTPPEGAIAEQSCEKKSETETGRSDKTSAANREIRRRCFCPSKYLPSRSCVCQGMYSRSTSCSHLSVVCCFHGRKKLFHCRPLNEDSIGQERPLGFFCRQRQHRSSLVIVLDSEEV